MAWYEIQTYEGDELGWVNVNGLGGEVYDSLEEVHEATNEIDDSYPFYRIVEIRIVKERGF